MKEYLNDAQFIKDYDLLKTVSLNPERHTASNAHQHCEMVVREVKRLSDLFLLDSERRLILINLAVVHDIGKSRGNAYPQTSVDMLYKYGETDESFIKLVKYHDVNLPWYIAMAKGQTPTRKAWNRLVAQVDIYLLCIFMVADRVDCPGGWRMNAALVWFLGNAQEKGLINEDFFDQLNGRNLGANC